MGKLVEDQIGKKVSVYSNQPGGEKQDVGVLEAVDDQWIRIRKSESEVLYFSLYQVRMIKSFYQ